MRENYQPMSRRTTSKIILGLSVAVFLFYFITIGLKFNVYQNAFAGALFELFSIPMLLLLIIIPVVCLVQLIKFKGKEKGYAVASLLLNSVTIFILV